MRGNRRGKCETAKHRRGKEVEDKGDERLEWIMRGIREQGWTHTGGIKAESHLPTTFSWGARQEFGDIWT